MYASVRILISHNYFEKKIMHIVRVIINLIFLKSQITCIKKKNFNVYVISNIIYIVNPKLPVKIF